MPSNWPRLSDTLTAPRHPERCQSCGGAGDQRWQECDQYDRPEAIIVTLCSACSGRLIEPHPRLYRALRQHQPWPGCMPLCVACVHRDGVRCRLAPMHGGPGMLLAIPQVAAIACGKGHCERLYMGPVEHCRERQVAIEEG